MKKLGKNLFIWTLIVLCFAAAALAGPTMDTISSKTANEAANTTFNATLTNFTTSVTFSISPSQSWLSIVKINNTLATVVADLTSVFNAEGSYSAVVTATDANGASTQSFTLTVNNVEQLAVSSANITLGSSSQRASNPKAKDDDDVNEHVTTTFTITNNGPTLTGLNLTTITPESGFSQGGSSGNINLSAAFSASTLTKGQSATVTLRGRIPETLNGVDSNLVKNAIKVAALNFTGTVSGSTIGTQAVQLNMQRENKLKIKSVVFIINDGESKEKVDDGDRIDNIKPGDNIKIEIEVESKYKDSDKEGIDIEDVEIDISSDDDDVFDLDEDDEISGLSPDDKETVTFNQKVESDAEDGTAVLTLTVSGNDENDALHGEKWTLRFEVERETHDIRIDEISLSPSSVLCPTDASSVNARVEISNVGKSDEDDVQVRLSSTGLGFDQRGENIDILDEDDDNTVSFSMPIPSNLAAGTYPIKAQTYYDKTKLDNEKTVDLVVSECPVKKTEEKKEEVVVVTPPGTGAGGAEAGSEDSGETGFGDLEVTETEEKPFLETKGFVALLIVGNVVVIGGIAALIFFLVK